VHREHQNGKLRAQNPDVFDQIQTLRLAKAKVYDHEVRVSFLDKFHPPLPVSSLPADGEVGLPLDYLREALANHWVVVDNQHAIPVS